MRRHAATGTDFVGKSKGTHDKKVPERQWMWHVKQIISKWDAKLFVRVHEEEREGMVDNKAEENKVADGMTKGKTRIFNPR